MKVKNKLRLGFGFLFIVVLFFGAVSLFYINQIALSAKVILKDNYETLNYVREMRTVLDEHELPLNAASASSFNKQLVMEEHNITEPGEGEMASKLRKAFTTLQNTTDAATLDHTEKSIRKYLRDIEVVNMRAIVIKNEKAHKDVEDAVVFLGLAGAFTFLVLFSFSVNFPGIISNPLNMLLDGIREISQKITGSESILKKAMSLPRLPMPLMIWHQS